MGDVDILTIISFQNLSHIGIDGVVNQQFTISSCHNSGVMKKCNKPVLDNGITNRNGFKIKLLFECLGKVFVFRGV